MAVRPVKVIEDADLIDNGGQYKLSKHVAIRVRGEEALASRPLSGAKTMPVYLVRQSAIDDG